MNFSDSNSKSGIISFGHVDIKDFDSEMRVTCDDLPILPTRNLVLFPGVAIPIKLVRENSLTTAEIARRENLTIGIVCQLDADDDNPRISGLNKYGVFARVLQIVKLPDETSTAIVQSQGKFRILGCGAGSVIPQADISASVKPVREVMPKESDVEFLAIADDIRATSDKLLQRAMNGASPEVVFNLANEHVDPDVIVNSVATNIPIDIEIKMHLLSIYRLKDRANQLLEQLVRQEQMMSIAETVHQRARESFDDQQRRVFLQRQMEAIDRELNGDDSEVERMREKARALSLPPKVAEHVEKELNKLDRLSEQSPDYSVQFSYLETLLGLPWNSKSETVTELGAAKHILENSHYGLEKVNERVLEHIAVTISNPSGNSPILCLVGPPGVGKTSLGKTIAEALGRKFERVSLGGLSDEAEIRGHRRTYIGAMPGRIIDAVRRSGVNNPVIMLDEIDKIGKDYKGDPGAALLEVLDPEQNCRFHDNYIDVDFDLSNVLFIATANTLTTVSQPLIDRMEVIDLSGYILEEKTEIARRYLMPRILADMNMSPDDFRISDDALKGVIEGYTAESGVRQLEKTLASLARKLLVRKLSCDEFHGEITQDMLAGFLGVARYNKDRYEGNEFPGVVTGLAWTAVGGEILFVESSLSSGKGEKLTLTGNLGEVMKESAMIALQYVKSHADELGIDPEMFEKNNIHIHVPEGAIPKDGPSAGITMATSIVSAFTRRKVREGLAMTGEITLRGKVLPVGGIKEKILAAKRAGITDIALSEENRKDIGEIAEKYREGLTFHYVGTVGELFSIALTEERV